MPVLKVGLVQWVNLKFWMVLEITHHQVICHVWLPNFLASKTSVDFQDDLGEPWASHRSAHFQQLNLLVSKTSSVRLQSIFPLSLIIIWFAYVQLSCWVEWHWFLVIQSICWFVEINLKVIKMFWFQPVPWKSGSRFLKVESPMSKLFWFERDE